MILFFASRSTKCLANSEILVASPYFARILSSDLVEGTKTTYVSLDLKDCDWEVGNGEDSDTEEVEGNGGKTKSLISNNGKSALFFHKSL